jgi:hypothetical protein
MLIVAIAWIYVVSMMTLAEATSQQGSVLGAVITFVLYGVLPLAIVLYIGNTPARRRARRRADAEDAARRAASAGPAADRGGHPAGDAVAPEREEP